MAFYNEINDPNNFRVSFIDEPKYEFGNFAKGYKFAANLVAQELIDNNFPDYQAYPVVFLYRHALELQLKGIIYGVEKLLYVQHIEDLKNELYNNHNLLNLSDKAQTAIKNAFPNDVKLNKLLEDVVRLSSEFNDIDPNSFSFRYPINNINPGEHPHKNNLLVNLHSIAIQMNNLLSELENIQFGLIVETYLAQDVDENLDSL